MRIWLVFIVLFLCSCVKTHEHLITAIDECKHLENQNDPENIRDDYDNCLLFSDDELKSTEGCEKKCKEYCGRRDMEYHDSWIDFAGCRCTCTPILSETQSQ